MNYMKKASDAAKAATSTALTVATNVANTANEKVQEVATAAAAATEKKIVVEYNQDIVCHEKYGWKSRYEVGCCCCNDGVVEPGVTLVPELSTFLTTDTINLISETFNSVYYDLDSIKKEKLLNKIRQWNYVLKFDIFIIIIPCILGGPIIMATTNVIIGALIFLLSIFGLLYITYIASTLRKYKWEWSRFNLILLNDKIIKLNNNFINDNNINFIIELKKDHKLISEYLEKEKSHMEREANRLCCAIFCGLAFECIFGCGGDNAFWNIMCDCSVVYEVDVKYKGELEHENQIIGINTNPQQQ